MSRAAVEALLYLMDSSFSESEESLLANLVGIDADDWDWVAPGGSRTIRQMVQHVASCKLMYEEYAFGAGKLWWDDPRVYGRGRVETVDAGILWLQETHRRLRDRVMLLSDDDLLAPRRANWGEEKETRWLLSVLMQHDAYHAGEINHLRGLRHQSDAWAYPPPSA